MTLTESSVDFFSKNNFWSEQECRKFREIAEVNKVEDAGVYLDGKIQVNENLRKTKRIVLDEHSLLEIENSFLSAKPSIEEYFQIQLQGLQGIQFLQYRPGDYFHAHADEWRPAEDLSRKISLILFLNSRSETSSSGFDGGDVVLYQDSDHYLAGQGIHVTPIEGRLIAFSSYTLHEVKEVITGIRFSLVSWFY
jgi:predicted 2-oxoglutarate/Fe(II)-dependent dioxygenase YbiX